MDAYIANAAPFARPILAHVRAAVHAASPDVDEAIKWGMPFFCHKGKLLAYMSAFKAHAAFGFYRGALVVGAGTEKREAMGSFGRLTRVSDLPSKGVIGRYVKRAVALAEDTAAGKRPVPSRIRRRRRIEARALPTAPAR